MLDLEYSIYLSAACAHHNICME